MNIRASALLKADSQNESTQNEVIMNAPPRELVLRKGHKHDY